jgi:hypothetical protein
LRPIERQPVNGPLPVKVRDEARVGLDSCVPSAYSAALDGNSEMAVLNQCADTKCHPPSFNVPAAAQSDTSVAPRRSTTQLVDGTMPTVNGGSAPDGL